MPTKIETLFFVMNSMQSRLDLSHRNIVRVPVLPSSVTDLNLSGNPQLDLTSIPDHIVSVDISECGLRDLTGLPASVRNLRCSRNRITSLEPLRDTLLSSLGCSYNHLRSLRGCPQSVRTIVCVSNFLESLDGLPAAMHKLYVSYNCLERVVAPPMDILDCSCNRLTTLEGVAPTTELICSYNRLTSLAGCPKNAKILRISGNPLENFDEMPKNLEILECLNVDVPDRDLVNMMKIPEVFTNLFKKSD